MRAEASGWGWNMSIQIGTRPLTRAVSERWRATCSAVVPSTQPNCANPRIANPVAPKTAPQTAGLSHGGARIAVPVRCGRRNLLPIASSYHESYQTAVIFEEKPRKTRARPKIKHNDYNAL